MWPGCSASDVIASTLFQAQYWSFRVGAFFLLNVMDDPAWLALVFC